MRRSVVVGTLIRHADGGFAGVLTTVTIHAQVELRPLRDPEDADFAVFVGGRFRFGSGRWSPRSPGGAPRVDMVLAAPELPSILDVVATPDPSSPDGDGWLVRWTPGPSRHDLRRAWGRRATTGLPPRFWRPRLRRGTTDRRDHGAGPD